ncbi:MAG: PPOX class F420-dependent oxidoreductase [Chloroflexi bacterium]|nr:PPOX class F420-dependent oxidoreductase [Chloroflexota bacterium]
MALDLSNLDGDVLAFLAERHLATLTTLRADGTPHVVPVGFGYDSEERVARIITFGTSQKVRNVGDGGRAVLAQVDGGRWLSLEGEARVVRDADGVARAVDAYAARYGQPGENDGRVAIEVSVTRMMGRG